MSGGRRGRGDGRNVNPALGRLEGEGADQRTPVARADSEGSVPFDVWGGPPSAMPAPEDPTYYDRPVLKEPVWKWYIPAYFYVGGAAGGAAALGAAAQLRDRRGLDHLIRRCRWVAAAGGAVGTLLLIVDLGRPRRFLNMLRVFRPTSPMNLGSWILSTIGPSAAGAAVFSRPTGLRGAFGDLSGAMAGVAGLPLAGYTAVLLSNTAVPIWQQTRRVLPPLFVSSAVCAAASLLQLMDLQGDEERIVRRFAVAGAAADLLAGHAVERSARLVERVGRPLHEGRSGRLLRLAKATTAAGLLVNLLPGRSRGKRAVAGILGTMGAAAVKFGIVAAGTASAGDPRATFHHQRSGLGGAEATGHPAVTAPPG